LAHLSTAKNVSQSLAEPDNDETVTFEESSSVSNDLPESSALKALSATNVQPKSDSESDTGDNIISPEQDVQKVSSQTFNDPLNSNANSIGVDYDVVDESLDVIDDDDDFDELEAEIARELED